MNRRIAWMLLIVLLTSLALHPVTNVFALEAEDIVELPETDLIESDDEDSEASELSASASNLSRPPASASNLSGLQAEETNQTQTATSSNLQSDVVRDETELKEWIDLHKETGGTVFLGTSVTITKSISSDIYSEITVDTGAYGLIYDGGALPSEVFITGEGLDAPVLDVYRTNMGKSYEYNWNHTLMKVNVTATGRDGKGGTAMRILNEDPKTVSVNYLIYTQGMICSYGEGAVGLWLNVPMEAWCYRVEVFGANSMAVYAPRGADLYYCKLAAEGNEASSAVGSNVVLDTCYASPEPDNVINRPRSLVPESLQYLYVPVRQKDYVNIAAFHNIFFSLSGGGGYKPVRRSLPINWDYETLNDIDTNVPGEYQIGGYLYPPFQGVGMDNTFSLTVEVRDPELPCIASISANNNELGKYFYLNFWNSYDPSDGSIILLRSDDEGETWRDATWAEDILWEQSGICFFFDTLEQPVWFMLKVVGVGDSNAVVLSQNKGLANGGLKGGDRTGTDREDALSWAEDDEDSTTGNSGNADIPRRSTSSGGSPSRNNEYIIPGTSTDILPTPEDTAETIAADHSIIETMPATDTGLTTPADVKPEVFETQTAGKEPEVIERQNANQETAAMNQKDDEPEADEPVLDEPGQTAPRPDFPAKAITIFFVIAAVFSGSVLLILHFCEK